MIILDTNIIIELFKGNVETKELLKKVDEKEFAI